VVPEGQAKQENEGRMILVTGQAQTPPLLELKARPVPRQLQVVELIAVAPPYWMLEQLTHWALDPFPTIICALLEQPQVKEAASQTSLPIQEQVVLSAATPPIFPVWEQVKHIAVDPVPFKI
jgi:hypothetical protein